MPFPAPGKRSFRQMFEAVRTRTGMYVPGERYWEVAALVLGYDLACEGGVLAGFREWMVVRVGLGNNLAWPALVLAVAFPDAVDPLEAVQASGASQRHAIDVMFRLIGEFDDARGNQDGLRKIYLEHERWLRSQEWYGPQSPDWIE